MKVAIKVAIVTPAPVSIALAVIIALFAIAVIASIDEGKALTMGLRSSENCRGTINSVMHWIHITKNALY